MKQPSSHQRAPHGQWADKWDPYRDRQTFTPDLDDKTFNALLGRDGLYYIDPNLLLCYCLDAPETIPAGSTRCIKTIGGFEREEYNRMPREQEDWKRAERAHIATAKMLKKILDEVED